MREQGGEEIEMALHHVLKKTRSRVETRELSKARPEAAVRP